MTDQPRHLHAVEPGERAPEPGLGEEWRDLEEIFEDSEPLPPLDGHLRVLLHEPPLD